LTDLPLGSETAVQLPYEEKDGASAPDRAMTPSGAQASSMFEIKMFAQSCQRGTFVAKVTKSVFCAPGQGEDWLKIFVVNCGELT
jgi:hypothetical protein